MSGVRPSYVELSDSAVDGVDGTLKVSWYRVNFATIVFNYRLIVSWVNKGIDFLLDVEFLCRKLYGTVPYKLIIR